MQYIVAQEKSKGRKPALYPNAFNGSVMARTLNYTGIVLNHDLPLGYEGKAVITHDRRYFLPGNLSVRHFPGAVTGSGNKWFYIRSINRS
jgi:hypothetical protein